MKQVIAILVLLAMVVPADAAPRKHWYRDPKWWIGEVVIGAAITADCYSTARTIQRGVVSETNPLLGPYPSNGKIAGVCVAGFGIQTVLHASAWHVVHHEPLAASCDKDSLGRATYRNCKQFEQDNVFWRSLAYTAIPTVAVVINGRAAANNFKLEK